MGLLKNIYLDIGFLSWPIRKLKGLKKKKKPVSNSAPAPTSDTAKPNTPSELPSLARGLIKLEARPEPIDSSVKESKSDAPKSLPKITDVTEPKKIQEHKKIEEDSVDISFFGNLLKHIEEEQSLLANELGKSDLITEMKSFWEDKKLGLEHKEDLKGAEKNLINQMNQLHAQEIEWQRLKLESEKLEDTLNKKEQEINEQILNMKHTFRKIIFNRKVHYNHEFVLKNGRRIGSLNELISVLHELEDDILNYHFNENKNDFSVWIKDVMLLGDLASDISQAKARHELISILENY